MGGMRYQNNDVVARTEARLQSNNRESAQRRRDRVPSTTSTGNSNNSTKRYAIRYGKNDVARTEAILKSKRESAQRRRDQQKSIKQMESKLKELTTFEIDNFANGKGKGPIDSTCNSTTAPVTAHTENNKRIILVASSSSPAVDEKLPPPLFLTPSTVVTTPRLDNSPVDVKTNAKSTSAGKNKRKSTTSNDNNNNDDDDGTSTKRTRRSCDTIERLKVRCSVSFVCA